VVVLDDGFQHRRLARDLDIVLIAAEDPFPGRLLPRGPYREPTEALGRAHSVVVTRRTASPSDAGELARKVAEAHPRIVVAVAALVPGGWQDLSGRPASAPIGAAVAAAAVARPEAFRVHVESETGGEVELAAFPDHYDYREADARALRARAGGRAIVITEKDAVKLSAHAAVLGPVRVLVQALRWESGEAELRASIAAAVQGSP
jgi:tetraacyldisaccharide 4'-kinase